MVIRSKTFKESYYEDIKSFQTIWIKFWMFLFLAVLASLPLWSDPYIIYMICLSYIAVVSAIGLNLLTGYTGLISLCHAAFMAIGAYTTAFFSSELNLSFSLCLISSGGMAAVLGFFIGLPCLRLKGIYLAMATMAFGVAVEFVLVTWDRLTGGVRGMDVAQLEIFGYPMDSDVEIYFFLLIMTILIIIGVKNLLRCKIGRAFIAIRDRDIAAEILGVSIVKYKIISFMASSFIAGIAGALYAYTMGYIHPDHFTLMLSIEYLAMIIVGGLGSILGSIFGAVFIVIVPELIKSLVNILILLYPSLKWKYDEEWNVAAFGLLIIGFLILEPTGIYGIWGRIKAGFKDWPFTY